LAALVFASAAPALAGPPYLNNDPAPTDTGGWEIYLFSTGEGHRSDADVDAGVEFNYGPVKDVQVSATLPLSFSHARGQGWASGSGHVELGIKYRFLKDDRSHLSVAFFPKAVLPTSSLAHHEKTRFQFPIWMGKDFDGGASLFGGGGYNVNPNPGKRNSWQAGVTFTQTVSKKVSLGAEIMQQSRDSIGGTAQTRVGVGAVARLSKHYGLLASAGPTWADHRTGYHFYAALGLFY
jgi:hypothetical protein